MSERVKRAVDALPELMALTNEVIGLSGRVGSTGIVPGDIKNRSKDRAGYMTLAFVSKQDEHLQSIRVLVEGGQHRDAWLIARTMIEGLAQLLWAHNHGLAQLLWAHNHQPHGPDEWFWYGAVEDWRQLQKNKSDGFTIDAKDEALANQLLNQYGATYYNSGAKKKAAAGDPMPPDPYRHKWNHLDAAMSFSLVDGSDLYDIVYREASSWVHWNPRSMLLALNDQGTVQQYSKEDPLRAATALVVGVQSLLQSLEVLNRHFGLGIDGELDAIGAKHNLVLRSVEPGDADAS